MYRMTAQVDNVSGEIGEAEVGRSIDFFAGLLQRHLLEEFQI
jgi:hypothetical protein